MLSCWQGKICVLSVQQTHISAHVQSELSPRMQQTHPQAGHLNSRPKSCDPPTPTKVKPFNLVCVFQHEQHKARMHILRQKEEAEEREQHQFRARPYSPLVCFSWQGHSHCYPAWSRARVLLRDQPRLCNVTTQSGDSVHHCQHMCM